MESKQMVMVEQENDQLNSAKNMEEKMADNGSVQREEDGSDEEKKKIVLMRSKLEKQDPSSQDVDDPTIRRFLRARNGDIEKASRMFLKYLKWRQTFVPNGSIAPSEVPNEIAQNKIFIQGRDKQDRPIAVLFGGRHYQNKSLEEFKRFAIFALDKLCSRMPPGQEKFTVIGDLEGWGYTNSDIRGYLASLSILQDYYPERLGKLLFVHVPYIFMTVWKIVYPFIDNNTKKKIVFVENKRLKSTLLEDIDENQLPEIYGGKLALIPAQDS